MNGKQAKKLRRVAMGMATTFDEAGQKVSERGQIHEQHFAADPSSILSNSISMQRNGPPRVMSVTTKNDPMSYRAMYRTMKKGVISGKV